MDSLPIALQCYIPPIPKDYEENKKTRKGFQPPDYLLVIDTETATENTKAMPGFTGPEWSGMNQSLLFGRMIVAVKVNKPLALEDHTNFYRLRKTLYKVETEYVFYPDEIPADGLELIRKCIGAKPMGDHLRPDDEPFTRIYLLPLSEFLQIFYDLACRLNSYIVGFNLPYDLSRLAVRVNPARSDFYHDGFSFSLWKSVYRPHLRFKHIGSKRDFCGWGASLGKFKDGEPTFISYHSRFIDLHTLISALTEESHSLASAAKKYHLRQQKSYAELHGMITHDYMAYNRRDVLVSLDLAFAVLNDYLQHPIKKLPERIYSSASIAKGYLEAMGIKPRLDIQPSFSELIQGAAMSAYYGGRVETIIRKIRVPVIHTDFMSMYSTVNSLMHLWYFTIARKVKVIPATREVRKLLKEITVEKCFDPDIWTKFRGMALIIPDMDLLPVRAKYGQPFQIGQNYLVSDKPQWFMLPDLIASKIRTGRTPNIIKAILFLPEGIQKGLKPIRLQNKIEIDPVRDGFFRRVIEERAQVKKGEGEYKDLSKEEQKTLQLFLKSIANAGGYGINAERDDVHVAQPEMIKVFSNTFFQLIRNDWAAPGKYFFAPVAALITAAARMMLALLECEVTARGGSYVTTDTDSMMIVADKTNHEIQIKGRGADGKVIPQTIVALSWEEVDDISSKFTRLNPYDRIKVPGSILNIEDDNYDQQGKQRRLYCFAIAPKRYCLFINGENDRLSIDDILDPKESGLKFFLDPQSDRDELKLKSFVTRVWLNILNNDPIHSLPEATRPLVYQFTITTAYLWRRFKELNAGKPYINQIKPFNFILQASTEFNLTTMSRRTLIAPFDPNPDHWKDMDWLDYHEPDKKIANSLNSKHTLQTVGNYLKGYRDHPEYAYNGPDGLPCSTKTTGVLTRRTISCLNFVYQGKGMMDEDDIQSTILHQEDKDNFYGKPNYSDLMPYILKIMSDIPKDLLAEFIPDKSYRTFRSWQAGHRTPQEVENLLEAILIHIKKYLKNTEDLTNRELFEKYIAYKNELNIKVQERLLSNPNSVLHHRYNLNPKITTRLRNHKDLQIATLERLEKLLSRTDQS